MADCNKEKDVGLEGPILHILVVGFHHKKGCQVDFSYPPLSGGGPESETSSSEMPAEWKHLPFLALPDGAHNYQEDTIYFHLPSRDDKNTHGTVYGVSCYRQINTKDLLSKNKEYTRGTVQKSVCVLSKLPLYGLIQAKLKLITHAYFSERDFSKTSILVELYKSLNGSLTTGQLDDSQAFLDLPLKDLILTFKHKVLVLFKLLLLERRVLFFAQPVHMLCTSLLSLVSLFPAMLEHGLTDAASYKHYRPATPTLELHDFGIDTREYEDVKMSHVPNYRRKKKRANGPGVAPSVDKGNESLSPSSTEPSSDSTPDRERAGQGQFVASSGSISADSTVTRDSAIPESITSSPSLEKMSCHQDAAAHHRDAPETGRREELGREGVKRGQSGATSNSGPLSPGKPQDESLLALIDQELYGPYFEGGKPSVEDDDTSPGVDTKTSSQTLRIEDSALSKDTSASDAVTPDDCAPEEIVLKRSEDFCDVSSEQTPGESVPPEVEEEEEAAKRLSGAEDFVILQNNGQSLSSIKPDDFGFPLMLFGKGSLCHPYMSLQQHDLLQDVNVRCFLIGASNMLFKQRRHLMDALVEVEEGKVMVFDAELRKQLSLTTADLRFVDFLIKGVSEKTEDIYVDGTRPQYHGIGWEGGDEWIRAQFKVYLLSLLATATHQRNERDLSDFNDNFIQAWKTTHNYRIWMSEDHPGISYVLAGHPSAGQLSMHDMKIRLQSAMQTTDRGKKLNSALNRTSVAMLHTGKAVGGALSNAKSAVSAWISGLASEWKEGSEDED